MKKLVLFSLLLLMTTVTEFVFQNPVRADFNTALKNEGLDRSEIIHGDEYKRTGEVSGYIKSVQKKLIDYEKFLEKWVGGLHKKTVWCNLQKNVNVKLREARGLRNRFADDQKKNPKRAGTLKKLDETIKELKKIKEIDCSNGRRIK